MRISSLILSVLFIYYPDFLMNHPISVESHLHLWEWNFLLGLKKRIRNGYQVFLESGTILSYGTYSTQMAGKVPRIYYFPISIGATASISFSFPSGKYLSFAPGVVWKYYVLKNNDYSIEVSDFSFNINFTFYPSKRR